MNHLDVTTPVKISVSESPFDMNTSKKKKNAKMQKQGSFQQGHQAVNPKIIYKSVSTRNMCAKAIPGIIDKDPEVENL